MRYIECPKEYVKNDADGPSLFMAGGISGCGDWQKDFAELLKDEDIILFNPRRKDFDMADKSINHEQIGWEYRHLEGCDAASFWFTKETVCPITLYELGKQFTIHKPIFVGVHPQYPRREDVEIQLKLVRPEIKIVYDLESLAGQVKAWLEKR